MLFYAWWNRFGAAAGARARPQRRAQQSRFFAGSSRGSAPFPADPEIAYEAFERDYSLLVYPGGEKESFGPIRDRKKIDFFQRKGFIRLALKAKVPIVPIVSIGAHESYVILNRGEEIAEKLGLKEKIPASRSSDHFPRRFFSSGAWLTGIFTFFPLLLAPAALLWRFSSRCRPR